jgi:two-component system, LytTR family, response regulator
MLRAILIDDEPPARDILRALLAAHPDVVVMAEAGTLASAREALARDDYDLVFLDIQLRGGTGFDLVPHVRTGAKIVFVTAFDSHALRAFEVNALDYLLKPVAPQRLARALARLTQSPEPSALPLTPDDRVLLKLGSGQERFVLITDIRLLASCENYSEVTLSGGEHFLVRKTMKAWETALPSSHFLRVHRTAIVNVAHITRIERVTESTSRVHLDGVADPVTVSYRYLPTLREALVRHRPV